LLEELNEAVQGVLGLTSVPPGDLHQVPETKRLWDLVDQRVAARQFEYLPENDEAYELVERAQEEAPEPARILLTFALLRRRDRTFLAQRWEQLAIGRFDWNGPEGIDVPQLELTLRRIGTTMIPASLRQGESPILGLLTEMEIYVPMDESRASAEARDRNPDFGELFGELRDDYGSRHIRRIASGSGSCLLTDRRILGVFFDDEMDGRPAETLEAMSMPIAAVTGEASTAIVFTAARDQFEECEGIDPGSGTISRFVQNRMPALNLLGAEVDIRLQPIRVVQPDGRIKRPGKSEIFEAVAAFCGEGRKTVA
jgi:hypothetical protein